MKHFTVPTINLPSLNLPKKENIFLKSIGSIMIILALGMIPSLVYDIVDGNDLAPFLYPFLPLLIFGLIFTLFTAYPKIINPIDGLLVVTMIWVFLIAVGAVPFLLCGMDVVNSIFESTSGISTTGATIMDSIESWPRGILIWRSMMQWIGGIAIIILFMFFLPMIGFGSRALFGNETSGSGSSNLSLKLKDAGSQFVKIYMALSAILIIILLLLGTPFYESLCITFSTISTGGFMSKGDSLASYGSLVKVVVALFMFLGGTNFYLHYKAIYQRKPSSYLHNHEFMYMIVIIVLVSLVTVGVLTMEQELTMDNFVDILFTMVSASTTTGFASIDYSQWRYEVLALMFLAIIIGGSTGSTAGGLKITRAMIIVKHTYNGLKNALHPNAVYNVKIDGNLVDNSTITSAVSIAIMFAITVAVGSAVFMFAGNHMENAISMTLSAVTTFGPALNNFGPYGSYNDLNTFAKLFMCLLMLVGRLEFITALIIFTPGFWREFFLSKRRIIKFRIRRSGR